VISTTSRRDPSSILFFPARHGTEGNSRHSDRNICGTCAIVCHRKKLGGPVKKQLKVRHFSSDAEVVAAVETWLDRQPSEFSLNGLQILQQQAKKCIELCGEYVE